MALEFRIGKHYRARTGELLEYKGEEMGELIFLILNPNTKEPTEYALHGPAEHFVALAVDSGLEEIDLDTHVPTGLQLT